MAVDKKIQPIPDFKEVDGPNPAVEVMLEQGRVNPDIDIIQEEDGGATIDFDPNKAGSTGDFYENLADILSDDDLTSISTDLVGDFKMDRESRSEWEDAYVKGLDLLGFKYDERSQPFQGLVV